MVGPVTGYNHLSDEIFFLGPSQALYLSDFQESSLLLSNQMRVFRAVVDNLAKHLSVN